MSAFAVTRNIDGDTFDVTPQWQWNCQTGSRVRPTGYDAPEMGSYGGRPPKTNFPTSFLADRSIYGRPTKSTVGGLFVTSTSEARTSLTTFPSTSNRLEFYEERL